MKVTSSFSNIVVTRERSYIFSIKKSGSLKVDLNSTDKRLQQLLNFDQATSYSRQKDSLWKELEAFFVSSAGSIVFGHCFSTGYT